jgi:hypothetical protein
MRLGALAGVVSIVVVAACGSDERVPLAREDAAAVVEQSAGAIAPPDSAAAPDPGAAGLDTVTAYEGTWDLALVEGHLESAGIPVTEAGRVEHSFMGARGVRILSDDLELHVFVYGDAAARARDTDRLDTTRVAPIGSITRWPAAASLITSNNLAVIAVGSNKSMHRRVRQALRLSPGNEP